MVYWVHEKIPSWLAWSIKSTMPTLTKTTTLTKTLVIIGLLGVGVGLAASLSIMIVPRDIDVYIVNPGSTNAAPLSLTGDSTYIDSGYGTVSQPFSSIGQAVSSIRADADYDSSRQSYVYVAPGIYHETVNLGYVSNFSIIADTHGKMTHTALGSVIVDGADPLDETQFQTVDGYANVYAYYNVLNSDEVYHNDTNALTRSICYSTDDRDGGTCALVIVAEANSSYMYQTYTEESSLVDVESTPGSYYYEVTYNTDSSADDTLNLYIHTFDSSTPTEAAHGIEVTPNDFGFTHDANYYKHRHCFDLESGASDITIGGFVCRYTWSMGIHVRSATENTIRNNTVYGIDDGSIVVTNDPAADDSVGKVTINGNIIINPLSAGGILVYGNSNVSVINNIIYTTSTYLSQSTGIDIVTHSSTASARLDSTFIPTILVANNTIHQTRWGIDVGNGLAAFYPELNLISVNNTVSDSTANNYDIDVATTGTVLLSNNNWYGSSYGSTSVAETNLYNVDPSFVNATHYNFHLGSASTLKDSGMAYSYGDYTTPTFDIDLQARDSNPDIGADERVNL